MWAFSCLESGEWFRAAKKHSVQVQTHGYRGLEEQAGTTLQGPCM